MQLRPPSGTSTLRAAAIAACAVVTLAGCASTQINSQWSDPQFQGRSLRGAKLLVVCEAPELAIKRGCQDQLAAQLVAFGATPTIAPDLPNPQPGREQATGAYVPAARAAGAEAVFSAAVVSDVAVVNAGPSIGIGVGGFGGGGRGGVGGGVGISLPIGGARPQVGHGLHGALTDVASGRLMWSGTAGTSSSADVPGQLGELTRAVVEAAQKAGFF